MPDKTHGQLIRELYEVVARLTVWVDHAERDVARLHGEFGNLGERLTEVKREAAILEERLNELKRGWEETGRRRWLVGSALIGALIGSALTGLINIIIAVVRG